MSVRVNVAEARERVELLGDVWSSTIDLLGTLDGDEWDLPTDCPGWTVKDQAAHVIGVESMFGGAPQPEIEPREWPHVRSDMGRALEAWVELRRADPPADVLRDLRTTTAERLAMFRALDDEGWAGETFTPVGPGTFADLVPFRVFDSWAHEQDIRRAVDRPGDLDSPVADFAFRRIADALPFVVGKKVHPPDGTTVVFEVTGTWPATVAIRMDGGRAKPLPAPPDVSDATLTMDAETRACLGMGRWDPAEALARGRVTVAGDAALARAVVEQMNFMF
jgi:uncharacterized protein (TIGR03083 family)